MAHLDKTPRPLNEYPRTEARRYSGVLPPKYTAVYVIDVEEMQIQGESKWELESTVTYGYWADSHIEAYEIARKNINAVCLDYIEEVNDYYDEEGAPYPYLDKLLHYEQDILLTKNQWDGSPPRIIKAKPKPNPITGENGCLWLFFIILFIAFFIWLLNSHSH
jgi:hypothetical protein